MSEGSGLKAFLSGAILGAGAAILFAPRSGEETREQIRNFGEQASDAVQKGSEDLSEQIRHLRGDIERITSEAIGSSQERVRNELEALGSALEEGKRVLQKERSNRSDSSENRTNSQGSSDDE
ncbi:MAG: YtxH domain-containing protein [bacterium]